MSTLPTGVLLRRLQPPCCCAAPRDLGLRLSGYGGSECRSGSPGAPCRRTPDRSPSPQTVSTFGVGASRVFPLCLQPCSAKSSSRAQQVDLTRTYSNQQDLADLLRRTRLWVMEDRRWPFEDQPASVRAKPRPAVPRRVVDRLGEDAIRDMIEARRAGMNLKDVAEHYGISESSVKRLIRAADQ